MTSMPVRTGGPAALRGFEYQLLWSLFHATEGKVTVGDDESVTAILEPDNGVDFEYRFGEERRVEQIKSRTTGESWGFAELLHEVLPNLYRCVDLDISTAYVFVTETPMGNWQEAYRFFESLREKPVPRPAELLSALDVESELRISGRLYTKRSLFEHIVQEVADGGAEPLRVWHLLRGFRFLGNQDYSAVVLKINRALLNQGIPLGEIETKRTELIGDLHHRAAQGNSELESTGFFSSHGLTAVSLKRWVDIQARARQCLHDSLDSVRYRRDWDVREASPISSLLLEEAGPEDLIARSSDQPLVNARSAVLLTGDSGQGKSWQLYRLGHELAEDGQIAILIQGSGAASSDLDAVAAVFCREIWGISRVQSLRDLVDLRRRELPNVQEPWLTVLIDGVRDEDYALALLQEPSWQRLGLRVVLGCRESDRFKEVQPQVIPVKKFTDKELSQYLKVRLDVDWIDLPTDVVELVKTPLFARFFCDLQSGSTKWRPDNEYHLVERAWSRQTADFRLAAAAVATLAARIPEEPIYPWPIAKIRAVGLRDQDVKALVDAGLLRWVGGGRSLEIWHDRILNWAVAEGLVGALRSGEIILETLSSRAIHGPSTDPLLRRLGYVAMDTLWLLTTPELNLADAAGRFLSELEKHWDDEALRRTLPTLGARITPYLVPRLESPNTEEDE
jgi:hypothetical protein